MFTGQLSVVIFDGQGRIRTSVARKERQIYSLLPLTARPPVRTMPKHRSWRRELNPRPADYKSAALPTELRQLFVTLLRGAYTIHIFAFWQALRNFFYVAIDYNA